MSLNSCVTFPARRDAILAYAAFMLSLVFAQSSKPCSAKDAHEFEGGREIIDAVLMTCYERDVEGLTIVESTFAGEDVGLGELANNKTQATPKRARITYRTQKNHSMLPSGDAFYKDTRKLQQPDNWDGFTEILSLQHFTGPLLSLKEHSSKIKIGDIVRLEPVDSSQPPLVLFYAGEQVMEGLSTNELNELTDEESKSKSKKATQSFFIYPYVNGVEWNTYPPRQHRALREYLLEHKHKNAGKQRPSLSDRIIAFFKSLLSSTPPKESALKYVSDSLRGVEWLKTPLDSNYCGIFHKDKKWAHRISDENELKFRFRVLRIKSSCEYTTLKYRFPHYNQVDPASTCWFAANTQIRLYNAFAKHKKVLDPEVIRYNERRLISEELGNPQVPDAQRAAAWYRRYLVEVQKLGKFLQPPIPTFESPDDPALLKLLENETQIGWWPIVCFGTPRAATWKLQFVVDPETLKGSTPDQLFDWITDEIKRDSPVLILSLRGGFTVDTVAKPWRGYRRMNWTAPVPNGNNAGHAFVVIGTRKCGEQKFVHFAWNSGVVYYSSVDDLHAATVKLYDDPTLSWNLRYYKMPSNWHVGDPVPFFKAHVTAEEAPWLSPLLRVKQ